MSQALKPSGPANLTVDLPSVDVEALDQSRRTPRPYAHDGGEVQQDTQLAPAERVDRDAGRPSNGLEIRDSSEQEPQLRGDRPWSQDTSTVASESGTEADDERPAVGFVKALPPAVVRLRKGLKTGEKHEDALLTPSQLDDEGRRLSEGYFKSDTVEMKQKSEEEEKAEQEVLQRRRFAEFVRRSSEVALMTVIVVAVLCGTDVLTTAWIWKRELLSHIAIIGGLILAYPVKLSVVDQHARQIGRWQRFRVPASFDPATVLYPPLLPVLVALSVASPQDPVILPNIVLGLASLPQRLFPRSSRLGGVNALHWFVSILPLIVSENTAWPSKSTPATPYMLKKGSSEGLPPETLVSLYPLHHALLLPLQYLTTTSLLASELHLLSAVLINLLLLAASPQTAILKACLWIGGVAILVFCGPVVEWNIALARVPKWKLRRPGHPAAERLSLVDAVSDLINLQRASAAFKSITAVDSDADEDEPKTSMKQKSHGMPLINVAGLVFPSMKSDSHESHSAVEPRHTRATPMQNPVTTASRPRRNTIATREPPEAPSPDRRSGSRKPDRRFNMLWCLQLTPDQARRRKWIYASSIHLSIIFVILGPVREYISRKALFHKEAVGWAIGYLLGQIPPTRELIEVLGLDGWIPLPVSAGAWSTTTFRDVPLDNVVALSHALGAANMRLVLMAYWAGVLGAGLVVVFSLTAYVEVDTRRKVFHGVMVAMLLPATFVDPCFCALALALALAVFLVLEVLRAGQVPPLGRAIGRFVAPYVDGRDLRGPVVVSHIFLLIGCAVPLWFSLASIPRATLSPPWWEWELADARRETAMVAGVVCVGMGDAAASLIGRRYGRHKWVWIGGKSLEGSAAFAVAVTLGLMMAKTWLALGGWMDNGRSLTTYADYGRMALEWGFAFLKAVFCACGASFMEAVLTGANDNVVVPVALWLLVKGVRL